MGRFHIQVCRGTACHVKGSARVLDSLTGELGIKPGNTTRDGLFSLEVVACIGACGLAPVIAVNGEFTQVEGDDIRVYSIHTEGRQSKMSEKFQMCCDECWHTGEKPCPSMLQCFTSSPVCHKSDECSSVRKESMGTLLRKELTRPAIFIGTGTCGLGAGAGKTLSVIRSWLEHGSVDADVIEVGCVGFCAVEPIMDIQIPGRNRLSFKTVTEDKAAGLLESVLLHGNVPETLSWPSSVRWVPALGGRSYMDEHPFFGVQTRWVLENCGIINPVSISEYIANGGYIGFSEALRGKTPDDVCTEVEKSGLRGRGGGGFPPGRMAFRHGTPADSKYVICNADEGDPGASWTGP